MIIQHKHRLFHIGQILVDISSYCQLAIKLKNRPLSLETYSLLRQDIYTIRP